MDPVAAAVRLLRRASPKGFLMRLDVCAPISKRKKAISKISAPLRYLQMMRVPFRGPFVTPRRRQIYLVDGCILTESEIAALYESGNFNASAIGKFLSDLKSFQTPGYPIPRRSQRVMLRLALLVRAEMPSGEQQKAQAFTVTVNADGGLLEVSTRMTVGQGITLINPESQKEVRCRVVKVQGTMSGTFITAFEFEERSPWFWPVALPPLDWAVAAGSQGGNP